MNYYPHHIGDYAKDTGHISWDEDMAYTRLLRAYYSREGPIPVDQTYRLARASTRQQKEAVDSVLEEFFTRESDGWHNKRADAELAVAREKSEKARKSAAKRWQSDGNANAMRTHSDGNATQLTEGNAPNNQEPKKKREAQQRSRGSRLDPGWNPSEILLAWAAKERPDLDLTGTVARFRDYWAAAAGSKGVKLDWEATFRNWVRAERAGPVKAHGDDPFAGAL